MLKINNIVSYLNDQRSDSPQPMEPCPLIVDTLYRGRDSETASVHYNADPSAYDSGKILTVAYKRNAKYPESLENKLLDFDGFKDSEILCALREVLPTISIFYDTITRITFETVDGKLTTTVTEDLGQIIQLLPVPSSISHIDTVPIAELKKITFLSTYVDRVKWHNKTYAFKQSRGWLNEGLRELMILDKLSASPYIADLTAIVVNHDQNIRGFLTPFMYNGDLEEVIRNARDKLCAAGNLHDMVLEWSLKLAWVRQITHGIVDLHAISAFNGDLKPENVLVDSSGKAILIDFLSIGMSLEFAAPEVIDAYHQKDPVLSAEADVYSLGVILWVVAEERLEGDRERPPVWRSDNIPQWYKGIVEICLQSDPRARPSASEVLFSLQKEGEC